MIPSGGKILFISQFAGFIGGLECYIHAVASLLRKNGFKTYNLFVEKTRENERFLSVFDRHWSMDQINEISEKDFDFTTLHKISQPNVLEKILSHFSPTLFVHDHDYYCPKGFKYFPYKRQNCSRRYSPFFCAICSSLLPPRHFSNRTFQLLQRNFINAPKLFNLAASCLSFVVLSEFMRNNLVCNGIPPEKIHVLKPFLNTPEFPHVKTKSTKIPQIVFAAQQVMSKGTPLFLEAISKLQSNVIAEILGTGARLNDFKELATQMGLNKKVVFEGWVQNPQEIFMNSDIAVFPSLWQEPFGLSGIEAMSCGIPVVGFNVGGISEWLKDGYNGFLIPERDTSAMAKALDRLLQNDNLRCALGANAKKSVLEHYSSCNFLKNFLKLK